MRNKIRKASPKFLEDLLYSQHSFAKFCTQSKYVIITTLIEDLTGVVISYEIYETSLRRVSCISYEMTTSVRFYLSYEPLE